MTLPQGWALARVDELAGANGVVTDGDWVESKDQDAAGEIRLTQLADVGEGDFRDRSSRYMNRETAERLRCTFLQPGDALIARMPDPIGRACLFPGLDQPAVTAVDVMVWRTDGELADADWFVRWVNSPSARTMMAEAAGGTTRQRIAGGRIKELELPVPPKAEQRRIVAKLDALTARLARARAELDRVPVLAAKLRTNALDQAFRGEFIGNDGVQHRPCAGWIESTFYGPRFGKDEYVTDGVPTARTTDFKSNGTMSLDGAPQVKCSEADFAKWGLVDGDLLVTRTGSIGKCAVYTADHGMVLPSAYLIRVRFTPSMLPRFAWMMFASPQGQAHLGVNARAVTQPNINANAIRSLPFPMLTLQQQATTVAAVDQRFARADRLEAEAARARALIDRLEAAILARAFRGELVPQDPADEPASVLLDRIRAQRAAAPKPKRGRRTRAET